MTLQKRSSPVRRWRGTGVAAAVTAATLTVTGAVTVAPAHADVFHGRWIRGRIEETFHRLGGWGRFGDAVTDELVSARNGRFQVFQRDSSIYWHPDVYRGTAHQVGGRIRDRWRDYGWEVGRLGYPVTDELTTPDGRGRFNHFEGGSLYWTPETDAHEIEGEIRRVWAEQGWETGPLGYPLTDETTPPDGRGRFNHFQGGSVYWSPDTGAWAVSGRIRELWKDQGWERGRLGYPVGPVVRADGGVSQRFQGGTVWSFEPTGVRVRPYDDKRFASYRRIYPLLAAGDGARWRPDGLLRELLGNPGRYLPFTGCPARLGVGTVCTVPGVGGRSGTVTVDRVADDGVTFVTGPGHPEGAGRYLTLRFDRVARPETGPGAGGGEVRFDDPSVERAYTGSSSPWLRLVVEASGPTSPGAVAGPFSSDHVGDQLWSRLARSMRTGVDSSTSYYTPVTG
ncbi:hypothetical protein QDW14_07665 [Corynebacterium bovis]|uniref:LGFP repeat-containing protein n=1 Tax=Corynebacterium bovis TaxID=36808 RepID=UPI00244CF5B3|nr:hypothetical protein [Corynebacterium bovis]MDH2456348.1 hypothetical protein [Corynebacterium bovis]